MHTHTHKFEGRKTGTRADNGKKFDFLHEKKSKKQNSTEHIQQKKKQLLNNKEQQTREKSGKKIRQGKKIKKELSPYLL